MLTKFSERLGTYDVARPNRYKIHFTGQGPSLAGGYSDTVGMMCESIEFPGQNFMSAPDTLRYGPPREAVTNVSYSPITATFICTYKMQEKRWFEAWQNNMMNMSSWEPNYYKDYTGDLRIFQLDKDLSSTYVVDLFEVYPKTIVAQSLGNAMGNTYHTVSVELMYHHWEYAAVDTPAQARSALRTSASFGISTMLKKVQADVWAQAAKALGNYQAEEPAYPSKSAGDPKGRSAKPPGMPAADVAEAQRAALQFIKGGLKKASGGIVEPGVLPMTSDMATGMAGLKKAATGMQGQMMSMLSGGLTKSGTTSRGGGMSISLGGQFNMRMKTPNMARMRGMANPLSAAGGTSAINMASKLKSMFSGGGSSFSFGGHTTTLPNMGSVFGGMAANAQKKKEVWT